MAIRKGGRLIKISDIALNSNKSIRQYMCSPLSLFLLTQN